MRAEKVSHLHPLHVAWADDTLVPFAVFVLEVTFEHHGDSRLASMRVIWEPGSSDDLEVVQHCKQPSASHLEPLELWERLTEERREVTETLSADTPADGRTDAFLPLNGKHRRTGQLSGDLRCRRLGGHCAESLTLGWKEELGEVGRGGREGRVQGVENGEGGCYDG